MIHFLFGTKTDVRTEMKKENEFGMKDEHCIQRFLPEGIPPDS